VLDGYLNLEDVERIPPKHFRCLNNTLKTSPYPSSKCHPKWKTTNKHFKCLMVILTWKMWKECYPNTLSAWITFSKHLPTLWINATQYVNKTNQQTFHVFDGYSNLEDVERMLPKHLECLNNIFKTSPHPLNKCHPICE
jgi:hypothetical protein